MLLTGLCISFRVFCQETKDPGTRPPRDTISPKHAADSTHHTDTTRYHLAYTGAGSINRTNSLQSYLLNNAARISMVKKSATVNLNGSWVYGKQNTILTNDDVSAGLDMDLYKTIRHFYYWTMIVYNTSLPLQINHQLQAGLGPGYNVIDKKKLALIVSDGALYEKGDLYDSLYGGPNGNVFRRDRYQTVRNSFRILLHWVLYDKYTLDATGYLQNAFYNWNDYILKLNGSLSIRLYKWLNFTVSAAYNKFTRTRGVNSLLTFGLTAQN